MRVTIDIQTQAYGLLSAIFGGRKMHVVKVKLEVSKEEEKAIRKHKLKHVVLYQLDRNPLTGEPETDLRRHPPINVTVERLIQGRGATGQNFSTLAEAQMWDRMLRERVFPNLKAMIEGRASVQGSGTFEL